MVYAQRYMRHNTAPIVRTEGALPDGFYTIELAGGDHVTLRLSAWRNKPGSQVISYLYGPNNTSDYKGFAHCTGRESTFWRNGANTPALQAAVFFLMQSHTTDPFTRAFALKSGRCARCGKVLTVPASIHAGIGPVCARGGRD